MFAMEMDVESIARLEKMVANTQLVSPGDGGRKKSKKRYAFNLDLSKTFFLSRNELAHPVMGTIFLVYTRKLVSITGRASSFLIFLEFSKTK